MIYVAFVLYLFFQSMTIKAGELNRLEQYEKPVLYSNAIIELLLNVCFIPWIGLGIYLLFFYSWKWFVILFIGGVVFNRRILFPLFSLITIYPIYKVLSKRE